MAIEGLQNLTLSFGELFNKVIPDMQHDVVRKIALTGFDGMVKKTPVDTGRARANWGVAVDRPYTVTTDDTDKQPYESPPSSPNLAKATAAANGAKERQTIYVTNALPYIEALENGHSKRGAHMVALTVEAIKRNYGI